MDYLKDQLITYLGNKRSLIPNIETVVLEIKNELKSETFTSVDLFSGSGVVARMLKVHSDLIIANDLELYSSIINNCFLTNPNSINFKELCNQYAELLYNIKKNPIQSWISKEYSPQDDKNIQEGERVFYTNYNAKYLDTALHYIHRLEEPYKTLFLGPLLSEASVHCNTSGVFKGFYKNKNNVGQFGGEAQNALKRITSNIMCQIPILGTKNNNFKVINEDANILVQSLDKVNLVYMDPPYNQHPYASNYFMLNAMCLNQEPQNKSKVSGIPKDWNVSSYNKKKLAREALVDCVNNTKADYIVISYNNEGFVTKEEFVEDLEKLGQLTIEEISYSTYKASRNFKNRAAKVSEYLFILKK